MKCTPFAFAAAVLASAPSLAAAQSPARHSTGMMVTGIVLTGLGVGALGTGIGFTALFADQPPGNIRLGIVLVGVPLIAGSTILAGIGIPLWVVGAKAEPAAAIPTVSVGLGSASLRWTF